MSTQSLTGSRYAETDSPLIGTTADGDLAEVYANLTAYEASAQAAHDALTDRAPLPRKPRETLYFADTTFHLRHDDVFGHYPTKMIVRADRPLSDAEVDRIHHLIAYSLRCHLRCETIHKPVRINDNHLLFAVPTPTARRSEAMLGLEAFEDSLPNTLVEGTPVRTTDRAGVGTKGTRAVEGLGMSAPWLDLYYDRVTRG